MPKQTIRITVNGEARELAVESHWTLLETVREQLGLTGSKEGCGTGDCGACSMIVDGRLITSCLMLAPEADGAEITTIEGLARNGDLHPVQQAFHESHALQCGYCTPGMVLATVSLLAESPHPSEEEIRSALDGNLCRCTGYHNIVKAVQAAAG